MIEGIKTIKIHFYRTRIEIKLSYSNDGYFYMGEKEIVKIVKSYENFKFEIRPQSGSSHLPPPNFSLVNLGLLSLHFLLTLSGWEKPTCPAVE